MGSFVVFLGCMVGGVAAFLLGRYLLADFIRRKIRKSKSPAMKKFRAVDGMFVTNGILLVALLRLIFLPYGLVCYFLSVTSVSFIDYFIGTLFIIFKTVLICLIGCTIWEAQETSQNDEASAEQKRNEIILLVFEILLTIIITVWVTCWAKGKLEKKFEEVDLMEQMMTAKV